MTPTRDYRLRSLVPDRNYEKIREASLETVEIQPVGEAYFSNMAGVDSLSIFPPLVFIQGDQYARSDGIDLSYAESCTNTVSSLGLCGSLPDYGSTVSHILPGMDRIQELSVIPLIRYAVEAWMDSLILGTWTAFETLAGDLWVAAVNASPDRLALLSGIEKRISRRADDRTTKGETDSSPGDELQASQSDKVVSLRDIHRLTRGSYNLTGKVGDLLRDRFKFTTLQGIREAYSSAFSDKEKRARTKAIDDALASKDLNTLSAVRNLIIHKARVADIEYTEKVKNAPPALRLKKGETLRLDGAICRSLIDPVVESSMKLITAVDSWLTLTREVR
jgi:hypothetical protein